MESYRRPALRPVQTLNFASSASLDADNTDGQEPDDRKKEEHESWPEWRKKVRVFVKENVWFERFIYLVIALSCVAVATTNLAFLAQHRKSIDFAEEAFIMVFVVEMIIKWVGLGFRGYFRSKWNVFDFCVVVGSVIGFVQTLSDNGGAEFSSSRAIRILRPLRTLSAFRSMRVIVSAMVTSFAPLLDMVFLCTAFMVVMGFVALEFFRDTMMRRCHDFDVSVDVASGNFTIPSAMQSDNSPSCVLSGTTSSFWNTTVEHLFDIMLSSSKASVKPFESMPEDSTGYVCPYGSYCVDAPSPQNGKTNFQNILSTMVTLYSITVPLEGWSFVIYFIMDSLGWMVSYYFCVVIVVGTIFILNLTLVIISDAFQKTAAAENRKIETRKASLANNQLPSLTVAQQNADENENESMQASVWIKRWTSLRYFVSQYITSRQYFEYTTLFVIVLNTVVMALMHHGMSQALGDFISASNVFFTLFFVLEICIKLIGCSFVPFITDPLNIFDIVVTFAAVIDVFVTSNGSLGVFRCIRLLRLITIFSPLRRTIRILVVALRSAMALLILLLLVMFLMALVGMQIFGGKFCGADKTSPWRTSTFLCSDVPRANFDNIWYAFCTTFIVIAGDGWRGTMTLGEASVTDYTAIFFVIGQFLGGYLVLNLFVAVLLSSKEEVPEGYNVGFNVLQEERDALGQPQNRRFAPKVELGQEMVPISLPPPQTNALDSPLLEKQEGEKVDPNSRMFLMESEAFSAVMFEETPPHISVLGKIVQSKVFLYVITSAILFSMFTLAMTRPSNPPDATIEVVADIADIVCAGVFLIEAVMKICFWGFWSRDARRKGYFQVPWNCFDFLLMLLALVPAVVVWLPIKHQSRIVDWARLFRALRPWSLIGRFKSLLLVFRALVASLPALRNATLIVIIVWFVFGVLGVQLFCGQFYACTEHDWGDMSYDPTGPQIDSLTACLKANFSWTTPPQNFDNIGSSMLTLFQVATISNWDPIMYTATDARSPDLAPQLNSSPLAPLYFMAFIVVMVFFLINFFTSVLVEAYFRTKEALEVSKRARSLHDAKAMNEEQRTFYVMFKRAILFIRPPLFASYERTSFRGKIVRPFVRSVWFERFLFVLALVHVFVEGLTFANEPEWVSIALFFFDVACTAIFTVAAILKWVVYGTRSFVEQNRNVADMGINLITGGGVVLTLIVGVTTIGKALLLCRLMRLYRVVFVSSGMMMLLHTLLDSAKSFMSVFVLLFLLLFGYTVVGMKLFGLVKYEMSNRNGIQKWANFDRFDIAMFTLVRVATTDNWAPLMHSCAVQAPECDPNIGECGVPIIAQLFFTTFIFLGQWVGMRFFTAVLMDSFARSDKVDRFAIQKADIDKFRTKWKEHVSGHSNSNPMTLVELQRFVANLGPPLAPEFKGKSSFTVLKYLSKLKIPTVGNGLVLQRDVFSALVQSIYGIQLPEAETKAIQVLLSRRFREHQLARAGEMNPKNTVKAHVTMQSAAMAAIIQLKWKEHRESVKLTRHERKRESSVAQDGKPSSEVVELLTNNNQVIPQEKYRTAEEAKIDVRQIDEQVDRKEGRMNEEVNEDYSKRGEATAPPPPVPATGAGAIQLEDSFSSAASGKSGMELDDSASIDIEI